MGLLRRPRHGRQTSCGPRSQTPFGNALGRGTLFPRRGCPRVCARSRPPRRRRGIDGGRWAGEPDTPSMRNRVSPKSAFPNGVWEMEETGFCNARAIWGLGPICTGSIGHAPPSHVQEIRGSGRFEASAIGVNPKRPLKKLPSAGSGGIGGEILDVTRTLRESVGPALQISRLITRLA